MISAATSPLMAEPHSVIASADKVEDTVGTSMTSDYSDEKAINRRYWDALVNVNADTEGNDGYNVKEFLARERDL